MTEIIAPLRFGTVQPNLYRGSYPRKQNLRFLQRLRLKTIVSLTPKPIEGPFAEWAEENDITVIHIPAAPEGKAYKTLFEDPETQAKEKEKKKTEKKEARKTKKKTRTLPINYEVAIEAIGYMINADCQPTYIHCLNGSEVTSLVVACLRKLSFWSSVSITGEYVGFAQLSATADRFIEDFKAEIEIPANPVPWMWRGLSIGVVKRHPTLKIVDSEDKDEGFPRDGFESEAAAQQAIAALP
ncbi:putative tyrosine-protein phosphatase OCA6 [Yarrowia sp. B02]|nr:putative tyrosine-protein phosphatase OCA6 [Yarrowia sp. B02]